MTAERFNNLMNRIKNFDKEALKEIYDEYSRLVLWIAKKITKNEQDAQDILSIVFTGIWNNAHSYKYIKSPVNWISAVAKNKAISYYNKNIKRQSKNKEFRFVSEDHTYKYLSIENNISEMEFNSLIAFLSEQEQKIVKMKILYKYTLKEIAEMLNVPLGTVCSAYHKALKKLKKNFKNIEN